MRLRQNFRGACRRERGTMRNLRRFVTHPTVIVAGLVLLCVAGAGTMALSALRLSTQVQQETVCSLHDNQVHLTGILPGKGGARSTITDGVCAAEYFILAQGSGSRFSLDPAVAASSLGLAVTYWVTTSDGTALVAVIVPATGSVEVDTSDQDGISVTPQSIVVFTRFGAGNTNLNGSIIQDLTGVNQVVATYPVDQTRVYPTTHDAILGAVGK